MPLSSLPMVSKRQHPLRLYRGKRRRSIPLSLWHALWMKGERKGRINSLTIFTLPLRAGLCFVDKMPCSLPVQLECSWGRQVRVAKRGLSPSFFPLKFPAVAQCQCPYTSKSTRDQGSITSFAGIDIKQSVSKHCSGQL